MSSSTYNAKHWQEKISGYQQEPWSRQPSPFAQLSADYFLPSSKILELGTGAGQDGIWFNNQGYEVTVTDGDPHAFESIAEHTKGTIKPVMLNILDKFPFADGSFDVVYAQLVLHYFDDVEMKQIMNEIHRVLKKDGVFAFMVNTVEDSEYIESGSRNGVIKSGKLTKRFFNTKTLAQFVANFKPLLFNAEGRTPKDDKIGNSGMIQFIGKKI